MVRIEEEKSNYLVRFSFTRFSVRITIVSCKYFIRGDTAWKNVTLYYIHTLYKYRGCKHH